MSAAALPVTFRGDLPYLECERRTLPCGLDVIVHRDDTASQVATSVWYRVGSSDERADRTGFAHLFEHLFKLPPARLGGHHHYDVLKRAGSTDSNASTGPDRTAYHEVLPSHQLALALWIESGRMGYFSREFLEPDGEGAHRLTTQQSVVRAERRQRYEDVPYGAERFAVAAALYPEGHPLRHLTIGKHADIQAATIADVLAFYRTWYVPANATLVIAGAIPADLDAQLDRYFGTFPTSARPPRPVPATPVVVPQRTELADPFVTMRRIHRIWPGPAAYADGEPELDILTTAWTATGTGALWRRLVYDAPLAQRVSAWTSSTRLGGEVHVAVDLRTGADPAAVAAILDEECARGIDQAAIDRVVTRRDARTLWSLSGLTRRAGLLQRYALYDSLTIPDLASDLVRYRAVTPAAIDRVRAETITNERMVEVVTLPAAAK